MAERRMFAKSIVDSDAFLDMPLSTQALYFHLAMRADDEGFVNNPKKIIRMINADEDSFRLLIAKQFIIPFESGIVVIRHWRIHNYIQTDRKKETVYADEKALLTQDKSGVYKMDTQVSIGEYSIGKVSIGEGVCADAPRSPAQPEKSSRFVPPTAEEVKAYCKETGKPIDVDAFIDYYTSNGWKVGGKAAMKDWKAAVRRWRKRDEEAGTIYVDSAQCTPAYNVSDIEKKTYAKYADKE